MLESMNFITLLRAKEFTGTNIQQLIPGETASTARFGSAIDISADGSVMVIGAESTRYGTFSLGAAHVFIRQGSVYVETQKLLPVARNLSKYFGGAVGISGDGSTIAVGAHNDTDAGGSTGGSVEIFTRQLNGEYIHLETIPASVVNSGSSFGFGVAVNNDGSVIVASSESHSGGTTNSGAVHILERQPSGSYSETQFVKASNRTVNGRLGTTLSMDGSGDIVVAYARRQAAPGVLTGGSVYVFERNEEDTYIETQVLAANDVETGDLFGVSMKITADGKYIIAGSEAKKVGDVIIGAAYIFERQVSGGYVEIAKLSPSIHELTMYYGSGVDISGDGSLVCVGSRGAHAADGTTVTGKAFVYKRNGEGGYDEIGTYASKNETSAALFGKTVCIPTNGSLVAIGATGDFGLTTNTGAVYAIT